MKCDFCSKNHDHSNMMAFPHRQVAAVAAKGYVPSGFRSMAEIFAPDEDPETYFKEIVSRFGANAEWALCQSCQSEMQQFARTLMGI